MRDELPRLQSLQAATRWLGEALARCREDETTHAADISGLDEEERTLVDQLLGEGEVSLRVRRGEEAIRIQESVLPGIWRCREQDSRGRVRRDRLEVGALPRGVRRPPDPAAIEALCGTPPPEGALHAPAILTELAAQAKRWRRGNPAYAINLTLLPMSPADLAFLERTLGRGPVETLSRGYGDCRVIATACPGIWWVRYTNAMGRLILNTLEITDIPAVVCAAPEDLEASRRRLPELLEELPWLAPQPMEREAAP